MSPLLPFAIGLLFFQLGGAVGADDDVGGWMRFHKAASGLGGPAHERPLAQHRQRLPVFGGEPPLVRNLRVESYELAFQFYFPLAGYDYDATRKLTFDGDATVLFQMSDDAEVLLIDQEGLNISSIQLTLYYGAVVELEKWSVAGDGRLSLRPTGGVYFAKGMSYSLRITYTGRIANTSEEGTGQGVFVASYPNADGGQSWLLATQFEQATTAQSIARRLFPCFDDPHFKAVFNVKVTAPKNATVLGNTQWGPVGESGSLRTIRMDPTPRMSTYLLALAIGDFASSRTQTAKSHVRVEVWSWKEQGHFLEFAANESAKCLQALEDYTGIAYPMEKLEILSLPAGSFNGAMENYGLIIGEINTVAANPDVASVDDLFWVMSVLCHEVSHQYFGDLVTTDRWADIFLNEAFATFMMFLIPTMANPERATFLEHQFIVDTHELGLMAQTITPKALTDDPGFDPKITYAAGGSVLRMFHSVLGADNFRTAIHYYLERNAQGNVDNQTLIDALAMAMRKSQPSGEQDRADFFAEWVRHPSAPQVEFEVKNTLLVTHQQPLANSVSQSLTWSIPIPQLQLESTAQALVWIDEVDSVLPFNNGTSVPVNRDSLIFARFVYDSQLRDELFELFRANTSLLSHPTIVRMLLDHSALKKYFLCAYWCQLFELVAAKIQAESNTSHGIYAKENVWRIIEECGADRSFLNATDGLTSWEGSDEDWDMRSRQSNFLLAAVKAGVSDSREKAMKLACGFSDKCLKGKTDMGEIDVGCNNLPPDVRSAVYCAIVMSTANNTQYANSSELATQFGLYKNKVEVEAAKPDQYLDAEVKRLDGVFRDCQVS